MQLLLLFMLLTLSQKPEYNRVLEEVKPLIEQSAGDGLKNVLRQAEQISEALAAFAGDNTVNSAADGTENDKQVSAKGFPLKPIADIADADLYNALSGAL